MDLQTLYLHFFRLNKDLWCNGIKPFVSSLTRDSTTFKTQKIDMFLSDAFESLKEVYKSGKRHPKLSAQKSNLRTYFAGTVEDLFSFS